MGNLWSPQNLLIGSSTLELILKALVVSAVFASVCFTALFVIGKSLVYVEESLPKLFKYYSLSRV